MTGSLNRDRWDPVLWTVVPPLLTFVVGLAVVRSPSLHSLPYLALGLLLVVRLPATVPLVALVFCQEVGSADAAAVSLTTTLGNDLYFGPGGGNTGSSSGPLVLPVVGLMAAAGGVAVLRLVRQRREGRQILDGYGLAVAVVITTLIVWVAVIGRIATGSMLQALNQEARSFLLIGFGFAAGLVLPTVGPPRRAAYVGVGAALCVLAALVTFGVLTGTVSLDLESQTSPFYDSAMPAFAAAVILALLFHRERGAWWRRTFVLGAAAVIVAASLRRNVWLAMGVVLVIALVAAYGRGHAARRVGLGVVVVTPLLLALPGVAAALGTRLYETFFSLGDNSDTSAQGHVSDIDLGWKYALEAPWQGIGSRHPQLPGAAAAEASIVYLHNEWLLDWLRYGVVGVLLVVVLMALLAVGAFMAFRARKTATLPQITAAMFVLILPISCFTAPFLSTTTRWPALVGIAAGVLAAGRLAARRGAEDPVRQADHLRQRRADALTR